MDNQIALEEQSQVLSSAVKDNLTIINEEFEDFEQEIIDFHGLEAIKSSMEGSEAFTSQLSD